MKGRLLHRLGGEEKCGKETQEQHNFEFHSIVIKANERYFATSTCVEEPLARIRPRSQVRTFSRAVVEVELTSARLDLPNTLAIITNRSIGRKLPHPRAVQNRCACPRLLIAPKPAYFALRVNVALVIGQQQKGIAANEVVDYRPEKFLISGPFPFNCRYPIAKTAAPDKVDSRINFLLDIVDEAFISNWLRFSGACESISET